MRQFIACLLLVALLGMIHPLLLAQQNQNPQKSDTEIEALKKRILELEKQLQIVENIEKMDLQTKLAEANAKLFNAEFSKFERGLRDSNDKWLREWSSWFLGIIAILVAILLGVSRVFWFWLRSKADGLIADEVKRNLDGFKEAVDAQDVIKNQLRVLEKEHAASMLKSIIHTHLSEDPYPEQIEALREETLLQVFEDNNYHLEIIHKAAEVLSVRKFPGLVSPMLKLLNSFADLDSDIDYFVTQHQLRNCVTFLGRIETPEAYQGLTKFLNRLLTENPKHKDLFLTETVFVLVWVGFKLNMGGSVSILKMAIPHLKNLQTQQIPLGNLARYFDIFNEPEGIKEILTNHVTGEVSDMAEAENRCLELLQRHDPEFVNEWRTRETTDSSNA